MATADTTGAVRAARAPLSGSVAEMGEAAPGLRAYEIVCPHCGKRFRAELLAGAASRYHGFKCAHCRLFVPLDRVELDGGETPA